MPFQIPPDTTRHTGPVAMGTPWHMRPLSQWESIWQACDPFIRNITVAVLDTGIVPHSILPTPLVAESFIFGEDPTDGNGHGTHVAATAVGVDRVHGVAPGANLVVCKVLGNNGSGPNEATQKAIEFCRNWTGPDGQRVDVINLSLGSSQPHEGTNYQLQLAQSEGILINAAAGNAGPQQHTEGFPAAEPNIPSIAAIRQDGSVARFSSRGNIHFAWPGEQIVSASNRSKSELVAMSGTSMACPGKSGLDALLLSLHRSTGLDALDGPDAVKELWKRYALDISKPGWDTASGHGLPQFANLVQDLEQYGPDIFNLGDS